MRRVSRQKGEGKLVGLGIVLLLALLHGKSISARPSRVWGYRESSP